eukprot:Partr_v1_DN28960_c0_g1_i1_m24917 putative glutamate synthase
MSSPSCLVQSRGGESWADSFPPAQGLYDPDLERDSCGVGFIVNIDGSPTHQALADASHILCNMTHRGAEGADERDGDGAGVMTAIPHDFFQSVLAGVVELPAVGHYATGNLFMNPDGAILADTKRLFEEIASSYGLHVLGWREVPRDNSMIGPSAASREPAIVQPFITFASVDERAQDFDSVKFETRLYLLSKQTSNTSESGSWFYLCSLSPRIIVYKGQLSPVQVYAYFLDLQNPLFKTHFALVHSRFSTNTFPSWTRAQPMRLCAHNGEINTLRGNKNWIRAREGIMKSPVFGSSIDKIFPVVEKFGSDSSAFDNVLELLVANGSLTLPEAVMVMIPEAWQNQTDITPEKRAFYEWAACITEPWDGPALLTFSDGRYVGACLDRNGLRPCRFYVTSDNRMICASEVGTLQIDPSLIVAKGRLKPGRMLLIDTDKGYIVDDAELKAAVCTKMPFEKWTTENIIRMSNLVSYHKLKPPRRARILDAIPIVDDPRMKVVAFSLEQLNMLILPMVRSGKEALGSMGTDTPLACLSRTQRPIYDYFRQLFAQVTNPPIDPIREEIVMSLSCYIGPEGNFLEMNSNQCNRLHLPSPILTISEFDALRRIDEVHPSWKVGVIDITFPKNEGIGAYIHAIDDVCQQVSVLIDQGYKIAILSDRNMSAERIALSSLVVLGAAHHHLIMNKQRTKISLVVETAEAREVHHMCVLLGYGADAVCPYLVLEVIQKLQNENMLEEGLSFEKLIYNFTKACNNGILKVMSKMGISTLQSYKGAQIFEILGLSQSVVQKCFPGTASRLKGAGFHTLASDAFSLHQLAYPRMNSFFEPGLAETGEYHWREGGESHINDPVMIAKLQDAVRNDSELSYAEYSKRCFEQIKACTLRGMLEFKKAGLNSVSIDEVEPWTEIVKRFCTGAMSYGSISNEAHSSLAVAMNRLGGKSNTGEGGEDPARSSKQENGDSMRSAIKQVASGRFGVTNYYLTDADEIQIKMAQGAKPGEGGELPGYKVSLSIAKTRKSTPGVGLISPPPHHDIYSIEDLKQLIYDLKCANPRARISVKLVSEVGVGVIAAGVAKAKAEHILIAGHDGGTGASRWTGIKYAGLPWELGLAEAHQTLVINNLRRRVILQTDGQIKTGRDVAIACLLGAEEWGFATTPLIAMGCIMMRKCHLNTCPVGIATQDPDLRKKFEGKPEHVINFFHYVAEEMRTIMASLGFRTVNEMVGRTDMLIVNESLRTAKTQNLDLQPILTSATSLRPGTQVFCSEKQDFQLETRLDNRLIQLSASALENGSPVAFGTHIVNTDRSVGATLSNKISLKYGEAGLPMDTIKIKLTGSAGQSFGTFLAPGISLELEGDANDYVGKGLSGGKVIIYPPKNSLFESENNVIVGNVCLYGATSGEAYFRGMAAERFCVRNSGASAVCEGVGDHGCEYMTGGRVVILGETGRNFAAGMSGGLAFIWDKARSFSRKCNMEMIDLETLTEQDQAEVQQLISNHVKFTGSALGDRILSNWKVEAKRFLKVFPKDYKAALNASTRVEEADNIENAPEPNQEPTMQVVDIEDAAMDDRLKPRDIKNLKVDRVRGFSKYKRKTDAYRDPKVRLGDWKELNQRLKPAELKVQAARCMDCGVPFCQSKSGCPIGNVIPKWNELVYHQNWKDALYRLLMTNNFPEFTGRACPAPCEGACVLGITELPVAIKSIECAIIDRGFQEGWIVPRPPKRRTGKRVAVIGSGPAGLAAADQLNKVGHSVTVYERNDRIGGLLIYGIPNMKLDKQVVQRRVDLMAAEGIKFVTGANIGVSITAKELQKTNNVLLLATGATWPRDLNISNRSLDGIHFAMEFLHSNTKSLLDSSLGDGKYISAKDKDVIVIGGGDTGNDCIGTSMRHGAKSVINFELLPEPPAHRARDNPWPTFPRVFKVDYGHNEVKAIHGRDPREYCVLSKSFVSDGNGRVAGINTVRVQWTKEANGRWSMKEIAGSEKLFKADLVLLAMGFLGPEKGLLEQLQVEQDPRTNIKTAGAESYATNVEGIFAAGDCRRGQSLIVWGINEGRQAARQIDRYLMGHTLLPVSGGMIPVEMPVRESLVQLT